jgi:hypothetical protein
MAAAISQEICLIVSERALPRRSCLDPQPSAQLSVFHGCIAGDSGQTIEGSIKTYPAGFDLPNIVAVANSNQQDKIADTSNYG